MRTRKEVYELVERAYNESTHTYGNYAVAQGLAPTETHTVYIDGRFEGSKYGDNTSFMMRFPTRLGTAHISAGNIQTAIKPEERYFAYGFVAEHNGGHINLFYKDMYDIILAATFPEEVTTKE